MSVIFLSFTFCYKSLLSLDSRTQRLDTTGRHTTHAQTHADATRRAHTHVYDVVKYTALERLTVDRGCANPKPRIYQTQKAVIRQFSKNTQGRRRGRVGADAQGESREGAGLRGDISSRRMYAKRLGAAGTRGTMWKTARASPPSGEDDPG